MRRREFITLLGGTAAAWPRAAPAQQGAMPVIGLLSGVSSDAAATNAAAFRAGLRETGYVESQNVVIDYRWAEGKFERLPSMAADLVGRKVSVILAGGSDTAVRAAMAATQAIPIVFTTASDPVAVGLVASLARPGGNVTGVTLLGRELVPKRLELLHELLPTAGKIAVLVNPNNSVATQGNIRDAQAAARQLGLEIIVVNGGSESEIDGAFANAMQQRAGALLVGSDAFLNSRREQIAALGVRHALPTAGDNRDAAVAGQLMSYGTNPADMYRQAGVYVGRVLKGEKPADLPVMQPSKFQLVVNLKAAKALGLTISREFQLLADEVIE
jgi:putative tryptophan/tyrosine transport system substrate-binding protein